MFQCTVAISPSLGFTSCSKIRRLGMARFMSHGAAQSFPGKKKKIKTDTSQWFQKGNMVEYLIYAKNMCFINSQSKTLKLSCMLLLSDTWPTHQHRHLFVIYPQVFFFFSAEAQITLCWNTLAEAAKAEVNGGFKRTLNRANILARNEANIHRINSIITWTNIELSCLFVFQI